MRILLSILFATAVQGWNIHITPSGDRLLNRKVGENFFAVCSVKGLEEGGSASDVQVSWIKDNEVIRGGARVQSIDRPLSSQLMIVRARKEDTGDYMCQVKINGKIQVESAKISFIKMPHFVEPKREQHPEDGTDAEIECKVDAEPEVEIFWQFKGETLGESTSRAYEFKENKQILVVPRFDAKKDDGVYTCNAAQFSSFETLPINVTAYSRPSITIFETPEDNIGLEGQSVQFKCAATGKPAPHYKWFKLAEDAELVSSDLYTVEGGLLTVNALASSNAGSYKCVASNDIGEEEKTAELKVFLKPSVEKISDAVKEDGEEITFTCEFHGEGKVNAKFVFGEEEYKLESEEEEEDEVEESEKEKKEDEEDGNDDEEEEEKEKDEGENEEEEEEKEEKKEENEEEEEEEKKKEGESEEEETTTDNNDEDDSDVSDELAKELHDAEVDEEEEKEEKEGEKEEEEEKEEEKEEGEEEDKHEGKIAHVDAILEREKELNEDDEVISTTPEDGNEEKEDEEKTENEDEDNSEESTIAAEEEKEEDKTEDKKWRKFVRDVTSARVSVKEENGVLSLTIRRLTLADAGKYQCIVENEAGRTVRNASLEITHAPKMTAFTEGPIRATDGDEFTLSCSVSAVPVPEWSWKRGDDEIEADGSRITIESEGLSSTLTVRDAVKADFGDIECVANNKVGEPASHETSVLRVVVPVTPGAPECTEHSYPNYAICKIPTSFETEEGEGEPTEVVFYVLPTDSATEEMSDEDFKEEARNFSLNYNAGSMKLHGLDINKAYYVRVSASNEAGETELSEQATIETTDAWAPEAPIEVDVKCGTSCEVSWVEPNNHGEEISGYKIEVDEKEADGDKQIVTADSLSYDIASSEDSYVLPALKPNTRYEISVVAVNSIGQSSPTTVMIDTPDSVTSSLNLENLCSTKMIVIVGVVLLLLLAGIDVMCFALAKCGVLACCIGKCRSSNHTKSAGTDLESGKAAESGRLLDGPAR